MDWNSLSVTPLTVIIRAHPYDPFDYCSLLSNQTNIKISPPKIDLHDLFKETDFMLTISSNTAIEAALYKKGILVLQPELPYDYEHHNNDFNAHLARQGQVRLFVIHFNCGKNSMLY